MNLQSYNAFCGSLPHSTHVVQWGGAHVWKIGPKVFAIGGFAGQGQHLLVTFKCSALSYELLKTQAGCRPAPYLASRGMLWIQRITPETLDDAGLKIYLKESYRLAFLNLPKKLQRSEERV